MRFEAPLGGVAFKGYEEIAAMLLQHGADIDADNGVGMTPIMFAAMFGRTKMVEHLQAHGASLRRRDRPGVSARWMVWNSHVLGHFFRRPNARIPVEKAPLKRRAKLDQDFVECSLFW
jgi:hypothetical protein